MLSWLARERPSVQQSDVTPPSGPLHAQDFYSSHVAPRESEEEARKRLRNAAGSAAAFYSPAIYLEGRGGEGGGEAEKEWEGAAEINAFLKEGRRRLADPQDTCAVCVVLGNETADMDCTAGAIAYAFALERRKAGEASIVHVAVAAIPRKDFHLRTDSAWLLPNTGIDVAAMLFADEVDLPDLHTNSRLQLVLVGRNILPPVYQSLQNTVVEVIDDHEAGNCSTLVAEKISETESELLGNRAICRLLLAAIISDAANVDRSSNPGLDVRDETMAGLLVSGAGAQGRKRFAETLRDKKYDQLELSTEELLRSDYKQWQMGPGSVAPKGEVVNIGISVVGLSLAEMAGKDPSFKETAKAFAKGHGLHALVIMAIYLTPTKKFKRELALLSDTPSLVTGLGYFLQNEKQGLKLRPIVIRGLPSSAKTFSQGTLTVSRKEVQPLLATFFNKGG